MQHKYRLQNLKQHYKKKTVKTGIKQLGGGRVDDTPSQHQSKYWQIIYLQYLFHQ